MSLLYIVTSKSVSRVHTLIVRYLGARTQDDLLPEKSGENIEYGNIDEDLVSIWSVV
jgi:hypothetical protein